MHRKRLRLFFTILWLVTTVCHGLPDDKEKQAVIEANQAELNQLKHKATYKGAVLFTQGSTQLEAHHATTEGNAKNQLVLATAYGNKTKQAHYSTLTDIEKERLHAYADEIYYYPIKHLIELIGNAKISQGKNSFRAGKIRYDTLAQHVLSDTHQGQRTTIILHPEKKHDA